MFAAIFLLLFVTSASAWFETCDRQIILAPQTTTTISSSGYYAAGSSCRYAIEAPQGFTINADCDIQIYRESNGNCNNELFYVMKDGSKELLGSEYLCGSGKVSRTSKFNRLTLAYTSGTRNVGQFTCRISLNCDCGWSVNSKIVGGRVAGVNEYISMVGLIDLAGSSVFCGGSIISPFYILTAAHCFTGSLLTVGNVGALVGDHDYTIGTDTKYSSLYRISQIIRHGLFNAKTHENDIALVRTSTEIQFNSAVGPACLPFAFANSAFDANVPLEVPGWGTTSFAGKVSSVLQTVQLVTVDLTTCKQRGMSSVNSGQLCTWADRRDTCQYDSGGNLYYRYNKLYTIGIVSYGGTCASNVPAVNTKILAYLTWIRANAVGANFCDA
ncbi:venom serine protease-like [Culicoides brevitarsis]|uniref:venom serine protease-like n=1 Tax=Culicoides brevitarsis TaxID=469753 RepID=UPI00307B4907